MKQKTYIYLAGKIKSNGWRQSIFNMRSSFIDEGERNTLIFQPYTYDHDRDIYITGPFFLSCDHSCYHGEGSHGLGVNKEGCQLSSNNIYSEEEVTDICECQIKRSDLVFAYINDDTCYGSLFEIGYAKALGKEIAVVFDTEKRRQDMWFISENADFSTSLEEYKTMKSNTLLYKIENPIVQEFIEKIIK